MKSRLYCSSRTFGIPFGVMLMGFTGYVLLDALAIPTVYEQVSPFVTTAPTASKAQDAPQTNAALAPVKPISITMDTYRLHDTKACLIRVKSR